MKYSGPPNGHMLIAQIAEIELQKYHPKVYEIANKLVEAMGQQSSGNNTDFVSAAAWPDFIRDGATSFLDDWHFYNRPYNPDGIYTIQSKRGNESNSIDCLERARIELTRNFQEISYFKMMFIRYVLHVVGDIHQPLHSSTMINSTFYNSTGDQGGNRIKIQTVQGRQMSLHSFWDRGAQYFQKPHERSIKVPLNDSDKNMLQDWGKSLIKQYPRSYYKGQDKNLNINEWTEQSYQYSVEQVYPLIFQTSNLTEGYTKNAQELCRQRAVLAGYRLAEFLIDIYGPLVENNNQENLIKQDQKQQQGQNRKHFLRKADN